jgi:anti-sigma factor RsiW
MTMHQEWTDKLSDYLDDELSAVDRDAVEAHLRSCAPCAAVLEELTRVVARAQTVTPRPPQADLWAGIAGRIDADAGRQPAEVAPFARREPRRVAFTISQLAAAAVILAAVSGGLAWEFAVRSPEGLRHDVAHGSHDVAQGFSPAFDATTAGTNARVETVGMADAQYDAAVADLEKALKDGRGRLDASTIAIVEHNLQIIDQAINQAREALVADPANSYLSGHLVEARRRKLDLLRRAAALTTETD